MDIISHWINIINSMAYAVRKKITFVQFILSSILEKKICHKPCPAVILKPVDKTFLCFRNRCRNSEYCDCIFLWYLFSSPEPFIDVSGYFGHGHWEFFKERNCQTSESLVQVFVKYFSHKDISWINIFCSMSIYWNHLEIWLVPDSSFTHSVIQSISGKSDTLSSRKHWRTASF